MPRYFVAIPLPDEAKDRLAAIQPPTTAGMRLIGRDEFHLTLHFIGDVAPVDIDKVRAALSTIRMNTFTIGLKGIGQFPPEGQAKVFWVGVEANAELTVLHRSISAVLADAIGFPPEKRPYSPHIRLARINEPAPPEAVDNYLEQNKNFVIPSVRIDRFVLYSSVAVDGVPQYREEAAFSLMSSTTDRIDEYASKKCLVSRLTDGDWEAFVAYVLRLYGPRLWHRSRRITQQVEPFQRYSTTFPNGLAKPYRHIRTVELLLMESPRLNDLRGWLTARGIEFDLLLEHTEEDDGGEVVGIRVLGIESSPAEQT